MESSNSQGGPPPFLIKTYEMVEDPSTNRVVSWGPGGASFIVWNPPDFSRDLLPKYFKHNNFSSFIRQLNTYGFRKVDPERWEFANEEFIRGHMHLLKNIHRRKPVHSHSLQNQVNGPLADSERREFEDEISRLKQEKSVLLADLQRQAQQQAGITWLMQSLEERLAVMEQRQQNIVAYVREILQRKRGDDVSSGSALVETDHFSKKRRVPNINFFAEEPAVEEQQVTYLRTTGDATPPGILPVVRTVNAEPFENMELALASLENLIQRAGDYASPEDMYSSVASPALALGDLQTASMGITSLQPPGSLEPSSPPELLESPGYVQSPMLPIADIHQDTSKMMTEVDLDSEESTTDDTSQDETMIAETEVSQEPAVVNDLFWGRFLTETPELYRTRFESLDADCKTEATETSGDVTIGIDCSWFNRRGHVEQITQQMEHLASGEKT